MNLKLIKKIFVFFIFVILCSLAYKNNWHSKIKYRKQVKIIYQDDNTIIVKVVNSFMTKPDTMVYTRQVD